MKKKEKQRKFSVTQVLLWVRYLLFTVVFAFFFFVFIGIARRCLCRLWRSVSTLNVLHVCLFTCHYVCVCVPFNGKTCGKFNVSDYQFSVGKLCSSMVAYCNAPFMSVKLEKFQYPSTNPTRREVEKICEKYLR